MNKIVVISNGISKKEEKIVNSIKEFASTGEYEKIRPYNIAEIDFELSESGEHMESALKNIANELVKYFKKNGAKNVIIKNSWCSNDKVYNGLKDKNYFAGWVEIEYEKEIKNLSRVANNLDKKVEEIVRAENRKMEEIKMVNIQDIIIDHIEEMEVEFPNMEVADIVTNAILDYKGDWMKLHKADRFDYLYDVLSGNTSAEENEEVIKFSPELTAISTRNSKSAEIITVEANEAEKILDYGCGTGRNISYIMNSRKDLTIDGCDIPEQLEKEKDNHDTLRQAGCNITSSDQLQNNTYDMVLNSHVLNVIESDEVKKIVVADIFQKLKEGGKAIIEVRTKQDVEGAKTKEKYGDGWKIKKGSSFTYQEGISKEKMINLVSSVGFKIEEHICNSSRHIIQLVK